jgi:hypothetical protein
MRRVFTAALGALLVAVPAYARELALVLQPEAAAKVYDFATKVERTLQPGSAARRRLGLWIQTNQSGWESYLATPPAKGIIVRAPGLDLQFLERRVLVQSPKGVFTKSITASEYSFLLP